MAPLGYAVMKYESSTKTIAPNTLRHVTWPHCENDFIRLEREACCSTSRLIHNVYVSTLWVHMKVVEITLFWRNHHPLDVVQGK